MVLGHLRGGGGARFPRGQILDHSRRGSGINPPSYGMAKSSLVKTKKLCIISDLSFLRYHASKFEVYMYSCNINNIACDNLRSP